MWRVYLAETTLQREPMVLCPFDAERLALHPEVLRGEIVMVKQKARPRCDACELLEHILRVTVRERRDRPVGEWAEPTVTNADKWGITMGVDWAKPDEEYTVRRVYTSAPMPIARLDV